MLHQWDQRARADARQTGNIRAWHSWRLSEIGRRDPDRPPPPVRQRYNHVRGAACRPLRHHRKPVSKKEMMGVGDREMRHDPAKNCGTLPCSATRPMPTPSSTAWSITPTGLTSTERACGEPVNPAERPEPVALWTCRCAWTTQERCPHAHSRSSRKTTPSSRDSRLTSRLRRCQKPDSQNASRPGRHQIATVGEIISESWARSNRYTRARSSESAPL